MFYIFTSVVCNLQPFLIQIVFQDMIHSLFCFSAVISYALFIVPFVQKRATPSLSCPNLIGFIITQFFLGNSIPTFHIMYKFSNKIFNYDKILSILHSILIYHKNVHELGSLLSAMVVFQISVYCSLFQYLKQ